MRNKDHYENLYKQGDAYRVLTHKALYDFWYSNCLTLIKNIRFSKALDVGGGYGYFSEKLLGFSRKVTCIDVSKEAIKFGREQFKGRNIVFQEKSIFDANGKFDLVSIIHYWEYPKINRVFKKVYGLLEPDGYFLFHSVIHDDIKGNKCNKNNFLNEMDKSGFKILKIRLAGTRLPTQKFLPLYKTSMKFTELTGLFPDRICILSKKI